MNFQQICLIFLIYLKIHVCFTKHETIVQWWYVVWCYLLFHLFTHYSKSLDIKKIYILTKSWAKFSRIFRAMTNYICTLCENEKPFITYRINFSTIKTVRKSRSYHLSMNSISINTESMHWHKMVVAAFNDNSQVVGSFII